MHRFKHWRLKHILLSSAVLVAVFVGGEFGARIDDFFRAEIGIFHTPDLESDLKIRLDRGVTRGKPHGRHMAAQLNSQGFRGPELREMPGRKRVVLLGSSETFGSPATDQDEYARYLRGELDDWEVINAAIVGLTASSMAAYWDDALKQLSPDMVVLYPNPLFYANVVQPSDGADSSNSKAPTGAQPNAGLAAEKPGYRFSSRFLAKLKASVYIPRWLNRIRQQRALNDVLSAHTSNWAVGTVPVSCEQSYLDDVGALVNKISETVPKVILVTHPLSVRTKGGPDDELHLLNFRLIRPQFTSEAILRFEDRVNSQLKAREWPSNTSVFDAADFISGNREMFRDLVHFNRAGAIAFAQELSKHLRKIGNDDL